jgi:hypothetical protein
MIEEELDVFAEEIRQDAHVAQGTPASAWTTLDEWLLALRSHD